MDSPQTFDRSQTTAVGRRRFLQNAGLTVAAALAARAPMACGADPAGAAEIVSGKDPRLIVHTARPAVFETPAELLTLQVTPGPLIFVRNNAQPPSAATIKPLELAGWKVEVAGMVDRALSIDAAKLRELPQAEVEMVLQCSGNGRSLFAQSAATKGTQWGRGAMANVRFAGVPLAAALEHFAVQIKPQARYVTAEGQDAPAAGEQDFEHSLPLDEALKKSLLVLSLNGQPLPAIHGGPVRLVTPGYFGTMHVKWLTRLRFEDRESDHTSQIPHYRTPRAPIKPGEPFQATYENSEPNWRMKLKCVVLSPRPGERIATDAIVKGVAFNDGETRIESVLTSVDEGHSWQAAEMVVPESPYAWYRWQARLKLPVGKQTIWARAVDAAGRTQPLDGSVAWNPQGYTWNGVEKIDVTVG